VRKRPKSGILRLELSILLLSLLFCLLVPAGGFAEVDENDPSWILMLNGREAFRRGNYGTALTFFRSIVERDRTYADAHLWIGYVFEAEGEYELAKSKYLKAIEYERNFRPYEGRVAARYALAGVAKKMNDTDLYRKTLEEIIEEARSDEFSAARIDAVIEKMMSQGPDKILELYRVREKPLRKAYSLLAREALSSQNYEEAVENYTLSFAIAMTTAVEEMERLDPGYTFVQEKLPVVGGGFSLSNTSRFLEEVEGEKRIAEYLENIDFYRDLFLLAAAFYGVGEAENAESLWLLCAEHRESGIWSSLAREQLAEPDLEELPAILSR